MASVNLCYFSLSRQRTEYVHRNELERAVCGEQIQVVVPLVLIHPLYKTILTCGDIILDVCLQMGPILETSHRRGHQSFQQMAVHRGFMFRGLEKT